MKGRKINDVTRINLKRVLFVTVLSLSLIGFPAGNVLLAQDDIYNRSELLSRIKILRKNFESASKKFHVLKKKYELLFEEIQQIEKRIGQEKERITRIKARRDQERQKRLAEKKRLEENLMCKTRRKVIEQLLHQLESQKR